MSHKKRLQQISVPNKCRENWDQMSGSAQVRHCGVCQSKVHNLSEMTEEQAESLLARSEDLCVRFYRRRDGTIVTSDCKPMRNGSRLAVLTMATAFTASTIAATAGVVMAPTPEAQGYEVAMGMGMGSFMRHRKLAPVQPESRAKRRAAKQVLRKRLRAEGYRHKKLREEVNSQYERDLRRRRSIEQREKLIKERAKQEAQEAQATQPTSEVDREPADKPK